MWPFKKKKESKDIPTKSWVLDIVKLYDSALDTLTKLDDPYDFDHAMTIFALWADQYVYVPNCASERQIKSYLSDYGYSAYYTWSLEYEPIINKLLREIVAKVHDIEMDGVYARSNQKDREAEYEAAILSEINTNEMKG